jgi:hypothetical protein
MSREWKAGLTGVAGFAVLAPIGQALATASWAYVIDVEVIIAVVGVMLLGYVRAVRKEDLEAAARQCWADVHQTNVATFDKAAAPRAFVAAYCLNKRNRELAEAGVDPRNVRELSPPG